MSGDVLLEVEDVTKHFPITEGIVFKHEVASVKALDGVSLDGATRRDTGDRRRVGVRQVDPCARDHAAPRADERERALRRP